MEFKITSFSVVACDGESYFGGGKGVTAIQRVVRGFIDFLGNFRDIVT